MKRISCLIFAVTLFAALLLTGSTVPALAAEGGALQQGRTLYQAGDLNRSLAVLRDYVQKTPDSIATAQAYALIGRILLEQHQYSDAILYLQHVPAVFRSPEIEVLTGVCQVESGQPEAGLQRLQPLVKESLDPRDRTLLNAALVKAATETQQFLLATYYIHQQLPFTTNSAPLLAQAHQLLQGQMSDADLAEAAFMLQGTAIGQDARLQLARRALVQQHPDQAREHLQRLFASSVTFPYWEEAQQLLKRTSVDSWLSRDSIGVLLPLSDRYASYGELVKKGLELALQQHNKTRLPARFIYRDTMTEGVTSAQLLSSLSDDDKVMAVIGPLLSKNAGTAARRAQREMVPLVAMAQSEGLPELGGFVFRDTLTAEQQVKALVAYAMEHNNISFSVMRPETRLGEKMTDLFVAEVKKAGGEIVDIVSYSEDSTDFKEQIQKLLWEDREVPLPPVISEETGEVEEVPELEYPLPPFHALFIPDYAEQITEIAPQLVFYGLKDATLLGINGWNSPDLISRARRFLTNAVFVDAFYPTSEKPEVQRFVELYRQAYSEEPTIFSAQAFEIATILLQIIDDPGVGNRDDVRKKLAALSDYRGITGTIGFDPFGEAIKQLYLLQVKRDKIVEVQ